MSIKPGPKKKKEGTGDVLFDQEQQFILRMPPGPAMALREEVKNGSMTLKDRFSIELQQDLRKGAIRYGNDYYHAKMVDLPCIIESLKTVDMKTFYKTADICQMLITTTEEDLAQDENESPKKKDKDRKYHWNHGITPPLKNVRRRRFRKTLKKKYMEQPDIEKEVKRLFRTDSEAISVKWDLITEDDEKPPVESGEVKSGVGTGTSGLARADTTASLDIDIFGEMISSDEEDEKDVNILDSEDDISRQQSSVNLETLGTESQEGLNDTQTSEMATLNDLGKQLDDITERMIEQEEDSRAEEEVISSFVKA